MGKKTRIAVLFGGASSEYEVSLRSVAFVLENLDKEKYDPILIGIDRHGKWNVFSGPIENIQQDDWMHSGKSKTAFVTPSPNISGVVILSEDGSYQIAGIDVIFPVLHGWGGEDGRLQGLLDLSGIPYVGCGAIASATCMDKEITHVRLERAGVPMTDWFWVSEGAVKAGIGPKNEYVTSNGKTDLSEIIKEIDERLGWPAFVKPCNAGSTVGVSKVSTPEEVEEALKAAFKEDHKVLIEKAVVGQEVECAVLGNADLTASVLGEIVSEDFYDYDAKYTNDTAKLYIPAHLPEKTAEQVREIALKAYQEMECTGLSRVDFFVEKDGGIVLNEINTLPGFTSISMYPQLMEASGLNGCELVDALVRLALERKEA